MGVKTELPHNDLQAKLILIGTSLGFKTYTPDKGKKGVSGDLCSENEMPEGAILKMPLDTVEYIDDI